MGNPGSYDLSQLAVPLGDPRLEAPAPADLIFDDEPLERTLYGDEGPGPTPVRLPMLERRWRSPRQDEEDPPRVCTGISLAFTYELQGRRTESLGIWSALEDTERRLADRASRLTYQAIDDADRATVKVLTENAISYWPRLRRGRTAGRYAATVRLLESLNPRSPQRAAPQSRSGVEARQEAAPRSLQGRGESTAIELAADGLTAVAESLRTRGDMRNLERLHRSALVAAVVEIVAGPKHPCAALCLTELASLLMRRSHDGPEVPLLRRALEVSENTLGPGHPLVAKICNNLGAPLVRLKAFDEAERLLWRATQVPPPFPHPYYWLGKLYEERRWAGDEKAEAAAWKKYLEMGPTADERKREAEKRLAQLGS